MALAHHFFSGANRVNTYRWLARVTAQGKPIVDSVQLMYSHASDDGEHPRRVRAQALAAWSEGLLSGQDFRFGRRRLGSRFSSHDPRGGRAREAASPSLRGVCLARREFVVDAPCSDFCSVGTPRRSCAGVWHLRLFRS